MLLFKKKFLPAVRAGEKTQTIRLWKRRLLRAGQRSYIPGVGYITILTVEPIELAALTDADARPDGFAAAEDLRRELQTIYDGQAGAAAPYRICFRVLPDDEQAAIRAQKKSARQQRTDLS